MADQHYYHQAQEHGHQAQQHGQQALSNLAGYVQEKTPPAQQVLAAAVLLPIGGFMLVIAALTLTATVVGLAVATPLFVIFSPVLVPAALAIGLATMGFMASGVFGITALSALSWIINYLRRSGGDAGGGRYGLLDQAKSRLQEGVGRLGEKTKDLGQGIQDRAREGGVRTA